MKYFFEIETSIFRWIPKRYKTEIGNDYQITIKWLWLWIRIQCIEMEVPKMKVQTFEEWWKEKSPDINRALKSSNKYIKPYFEDAFLYGKKQAIKDMEQNND